MNPFPKDKLTSILKNGDYKKIQLIQGKETIPAFGRKDCMSGPCIYFFEGGELYGVSSLEKLYNKGELAVDGIQLFDPTDKKNERGWWGGKSRRRRRNRSTKRRYRKSSKRFS